jgi:hypothetical protein
VVLLFMGVIFAVMGVAFLVIAGGAGIVGSTFNILGLTFTGVGVLLFVIGIGMARSSGRRRAVLQSGLPGMATVTALSDTGVTINDSPLANIQFLVQVPGRAPYPVTKRMTLPRLMVGRVAPGVTVPVKVDPTDPEEIVIDWDQPNVMAGNLGGLMGAAFTQGGGMQGGGAAAGYGQPAGGYGQPATSAQAPGGTPAYGTPQTGWSSQQGYVSTTVIDASGGQAPVVLSSSGGGLDQQTLDRINRALYEHGMSGAMGPVIPASALPGAMPAAAPASAGGGGFGLLDPKQAERLSAVGYTGRATVDGFQDTGVATGDEHLYTFQLSVHVDGRPDEKVRHAAMVPQRALGRIANGATLPVRVDPLDTSQLLVEWDKG